MPSTRRAGRTALTSTTKSAVKCDINGDGKTNADDAQLILDYASGKMTEEEIAEKDYNFKKADINKDGRIDTFDAHLLLNLNSRNAEMAYLLRVDTEDASTQIAATLPAETAALFAPDSTTLPAALTSSTPVSVSISQDTLSLAPSVSARLTAFAAPWNLADTSVTWSSSDEDVATVDETGLVTAKSVGTATITAAASADPSVTATCTVTVTAVDVTITGALQDENRNAELFTWNLGTDSIWTPGTALDNSVEAVTAASDGSIWQMDAYDYYMHQVSADGETLGSYQGTGTPMADIGYSPFFSEQEGKAQIYGIYQWHLYLQQDPTALTSDYMDMIVYLMLFAGAGEFVATTSGIPGTIIDTEGAAHEGETVYMVDNGGNIWNLGFYEDGGNVSATFGFVPSDNLTYGAPAMIPIEDIIEAQGITLEYQCLRKTGCILGETIFDDGLAAVYDLEKGEYTFIEVRGGTILIDSSLCGEDASTGRLRFTCAHELGHWLLHKRIYCGTGESAALLTGSYDADKLEIQANLLGSILLLPMPQVKRCYYQLRMGRDRQQLVADMAQVFQVSKQTMRIRLENHNLL